MAKRKISKFAQCIGSELKGRKFKDKAAVIKAFKDAVAKCKLKK